MSAGVDDGACAASSGGQAATAATADSAAASERAGPRGALAATFIGGGNMAMALVGGLLDDGASAQDLRVVEPSATQRARLRERWPRLMLHERVAPAALAGSAIVVMAVKPQQMRSAAESLAPCIAAVPVVLTIAAGIRIADLRRWLGGWRGAVVRAMPNTPALIGRGISGVFADPGVAASGRALAERVLGAAGMVVWCPDEPSLDAVTGVSGSGPAYVFYLLEALERAGVAQGLGAKTARRLAYATFAGAVALAEASGEEPAALRANVTSKGGTTEAGLAALAARDVAAAIDAAVAAATARARALGDEFGAG